MKNTIPPRPETIPIGKSRYVTHSAHLPHLGDAHDHRVLHALAALRPKAKKAD